MKKIIVLGLVLVLSIGTATVFADSPTEILESVTGLTQTEIREGYSDGKTVHDLAEEQGATEEFNAALIADTEARMAELVAEGKITQERADSFIETFKERIENGDFANYNGRGNMGNRGNRQDRPERNPLLDETQRDAMQAEMDGARETVINQLVSEGLIDQDTANEINALMDEKEAFRDENPGERPPRLNLRSLFDEDAIERFKELIEIEKAEAVDTLVDNGTISQEEADALEERHEERLERQSQRFNQKGMNGQGRGQGGRGNNGIGFGSQAI